MKEFLATGHLGSAQLGKTGGDVRAALGEPVEIQGKPTSEVWKYGALEIGFIHYRIRGDPEPFVSRIGVYFQQSSSNDLPSVFTEWRPTGESSIDEFKQYLASVGLQPAFQVASKRSTQFIMQSGVSVLFEEGKLHCVQHCPVGSTNGKQMEDAVRRYPADAMYELRKQAAKQGVAVGQVVMAQHYEMAAEAVAEREREVQKQRRKRPRSEQSTITAKIPTAPDPNAFREKLNAFRNMVAGTNASPLSGILDAQNEALKKKLSELPPEKAAGIEETMNRIVDVPEKVPKTIRGMLDEVREKLAGARPEQLAQLDLMQAQHEEVMKKLSKITPDKAANFEQIMGRMADAVGRMADVMMPKEDIPAGETWQEAHQKWEAEHGEEWRKMLAEKAGQSPYFLGEPAESEYERRPAWKPITKKGDGDITASKFSGTPWLAKDETWPVCQACRTPMDLIVQLNIAQLPEELGGRFGDGLLQLFYCTNEPECRARTYRPFSEGKLVRVVQTSDRELASDIEIPPGQFPARIITGWKLCKEDAPLEGDKLWGWPNWVQDVSYPKCPRCAGRMEFIFQLDSNDNVPFMWGDMGRGHITQCPQHKDIVTFAWAGC